MQASVVRPFVKLGTIVIFGIMALTPALNAAEGATIPLIDGKTLSGEPVRLPGTKSTKPVVLVFGFARSAKEQGVMWGKELVALRQQNANFDFYQVAMLSGAPRFTHRMIGQAIRLNVPVAYQHHFLLLADGAREWRSLLHVTDDGLAYVALCNPAGELQWRTRGAGKEQFDALRTQLQKNAD